MGILFSFARLSRGLKADRVDKRIQIIDDAVIETIELRALLVGDSGIGGDRAQQACGQGGVHSLEELQEDQTD
jgi:hypothetical protein